MTPEPDEARREADRLREQIEEQRRDLADTVTALHDKADVKGRARDKAADAEIAAANLTRHVGRTADALPRLARKTATAVSDQAHKIPQPLRTPVERAAALVRRRLRIFLASWAALVAVMAVRRHRSR